jgi:hypothetical protein
LDSVRIHAFDEMGSEKARPAGYQEGQSSNTPSRVFRVMQQRSLADDSQRVSVLEGEQRSRREAHQR